MSFSGDLYPSAGATSVMTTKGDVVRYDSQRERYGIGSTNQVLQVSSGGLPAWQTLASGGATVEEDRVNITSNVTFTVDAFNDITGLVITIGNITDGKTLISCIIAMERDSAGGCQFTLEDDGSVITETTAWTETGSSGAENQKRMIPMSYSMDSNASVIQAQAKTDGSTLTVRGSASGQSSTISSISVG